MNIQQEIDTLKIRINESKKAQRLAQEERKACRGFDGEEMVKRNVKQRTWQRCVIGTGSRSFKSNTVEIIEARWPRG